SASNVETIIDPVSTGPRIGQLIISPNFDFTSKPVSLTLTAINVSAETEEIWFYRDSNRDGILDSGDSLLDIVNDGSNGWSTTTSLFGLEGWQTYFAIAYDSDLMPGNTVAASYYVSPLTTVPIGFGSGQSYGFMRDPDDAPMVAAISNYLQGTPHDDSY